MDTADWGKEEPALRLGLECEAYPEKSRDWEDLKGHIACPFEAQ